MRPAGWVGAGGAVNDAGATTVEGSWVFRVPAGPPELMVVPSAFFTVLCCPVIGVGGTNSPL